jgi:hypothetical protein
VKLVACPSASDLRTAWLLFQVAILLWCIWPVRKKSIQLNLPPGLKMFQQTALCTFRFTEHLMKSSHHWENRRGRWEPPRTNFIKVNFDGAFSGCMGVGGWRFCAREVGSVNSSFRCSPSSAFACLQAIQFSDDAGMDWVLFFREWIGSFFEMRSLWPLST